MELIQKISNLLLANKQVVLVGKSDTGKSHIIQDELIPLLEKTGKRVAYFKDGDHISPTEDAEIFIIDEAETFFDAHRLQTAHPDDHPYYSSDYIARVQKWHLAYTNLQKPSLFIITRNASEDIEYLVQNFNRTDWDNRPIITLKWPR
jgi:hypothetical protein